jgi:hypothetical protein
MTRIERLSQLAPRLSEDEPPFPAVIPWHARNTLHFHEQAYSLCSCGKGFTDMASQKQHQAWCKTHLGKA